MNYTLGVTLTANMSQMVSGLNAGQAAINNFGNNANNQLGGFTRNIAQANSATAGFGQGLRLAANPAPLTQLNRTLTQTQGRVAALNQTLNNGQGGLRSIPNASNQAANALQNFGRIAQDAPFGLMGITNNINPLIESFQRLRTTTGSTGGALRALVTGLTGAGGVGLAFSIISSALTFAVMGMQAWRMRTAEAKKTVDEATEAHKKFLDSLDDISRAHMQGAQDARKEIVELKTLYKVATDVTNGLQLRLKATNSLQALYPEYFKNISDEVIMSGNATNAYDRLTNSIIATSKARAAQNIITKNSERQLENETRAAQLQMQIDKERLTLSQAMTKVRNVDNTPRGWKNGKWQGGFASLGGEGDAKAALLKQDADKKINALYNERLNIITDTNILTDRNAKLEGLVLQQVKSGAKIFTDTKTGRKARVKDTKDLADVTGDLNKEYIKIDLMSGLAFGEKQQKKFEATQKAIGQLIDMGYKPASKAIQDLLTLQNKFLTMPVMKFAPVKAAKDYEIKLTPAKIENDPFAAYEKLFAARLERQREFNDEFNSVIQEGAVSGIGSMAASFGEALASGGNMMEALGSTLLGAIGGILTQLGKAAIGIGVAMKAIKLSFKNPFAAIAAGVALVALGAIMSSQAQSIVGQVGGGERTERVAFANGGLTYGPTNALVGEYPGARNNPEVIAPLDKLKAILEPSIKKSVNMTLSGMPGYGIASGNGHIGSKDFGADGLNSIESKNTEPIVLTTRHEIEGENLVLVTDRAKRRMGRTMG